MSHLKVTPQTSISSSPQKQQQPKRDASSSLYCSIAHIHVPIPSYSIPSSRSAPYYYSIRRRIASASSFWGRPWKLVDPGSLYATNYPYWANTYGDIIVKYFERSRYVTHRKREAFAGSVGSGGVGEGDREVGLVFSGDVVQGWTEYHQTVNYIFYKQYDSWNFQIYDNFLLSIIIISLLVRITIFKMYNIKNT